MEGENKLYLIFVNPVGKDSNGLYQYEFFFSEKPDIVWGEDWAEQCPSACENIIPEEKTYSVIKTLKTEIEFTCAQEQSCFSMQDMIDGCCACVFESLANINVYPEPFRLVFKFREEYDIVLKKLRERSCMFEDE